MEPNGDEMFHRRKNCWLSYGRAVLTIAVLGLLTVSLYAVTQSNSGHDEHSSRVIVVDGDENVHQSGPHEDGFVKSVNGDEVAISDQLTGRKIVKRFIRNNNVEGENSNEVPKNEQSVQSLNDVNSDNNPQMDSQHLTLLKRQQGSNQNLQHRHSDGVTYYFKGYKCFPIRKKSESLIRKNPEVRTTKRLRDKGTFNAIASALLLKFLSPFHSFSSSPKPCE